MRNILTLALLGVAAATLTGCPSAPVKPETPVENRDVNAGAKSDGSATTTTVDDKGLDGKNIDPLLDPKNVNLAKRSIYFDYDKYDIQDKFKPVVDAHARYLISHPERKMLIQGNTDERGSREYNLALGQRRADAAKRALTLLGAKEGQIESVSLGEEKPRALGKDEASYAENRRDDMIYNGEF
jgi:peptidoglycan-associated lipoprotein